MKTETKILKMAELAKIQMAVDSIADSVKTLSTHCAELADMIKNQFPECRNDNIDEHYMIDKVMKILGCSRPLVYKLLYEGKLKAVRVGKRGLRVSKGSIKIYLEENVILPMDIKLK